MPVYNQTRYLDAAVESILGQTFGDFEYLIIDDGSTDHTPSLLQEYARRDRRIRLILAPHRGIPQTRNALLRAAENELVAWIDSDDISTPDRLRRQFEAMSADPDLWVLGTRTSTIDANGRIIKANRVIRGPSRVAAAMHRGCKVAQSSCMMRRDRIIGLGGYRAAYAFSQDFDLFLRVAERGKIDNLDYVGLHYRSHGDNVSSKNTTMQNILADMARATHALRSAGRPDPTDKLTGPPALDDPILDALLGSKIATHRLLDRIERGFGSPDSNLRALVRAKVDRKQRGGYRKATVKILRTRKLDATGIFAFLRAAAFGPGRLLKQFRTQRRG